MFDSVYLAMMEEQHRQSFVYPRAERRAQLARELELLRRVERAKRHRAPERLLGRIPVGLGSASRRLRERLAAFPALSKSPRIPV